MGFRIIGLNHAGGEQEGAEPQGSESPRFSRFRGTSVLLGFFLSEGCVEAAHEAPALGGANLAPRDPVP